MTGVGGGPLEACAGDEACVTSVAHAFAAAMRVAWDAELMHGDLGLRNVLIDPLHKTIALIDPGPGEACRACDAGDCCAAAHDLGHLVAELATDLSDVIGRPAARLAKEVFVTAVLQSATQCTQVQLRHSIQMHFDTALTKGVSRCSIWHRVVRAIAERRSTALLASLPCIDREDSACSPR
jgi:hypothetical protein